MNLFSVLERGALEFPAKAAIRFEDPLRPRTITYRELYDKACRFSAALACAGIGKGDLLAVFLPNVPEYPIVTYAALRLGAVPVLLSSAIKREQVKHYLESSGAKVLATSENLSGEALDTTDLPSLHTIFIIPDSATGDQAESFPPVTNGRVPPLCELTSTDPALILYTSGTTGEQKGAVLSHGNITSNIAATVRHTGMTSQDVVLCFLPLFHCFGQNFVMNSAFHAGATLVLHRRFELQEILDSLTKHRITMFFSIPPNYRMLLELSDITPFQSVRYFFSAADAMPPDVAARWEQKYGRRIHEGWGLTETSPFATYNHDREYRKGTVGTPIEGVEIKIADERRNQLLAGEIGEIAVKGPNVFLGYFHEPAATQAVLQDGWFYTGDIGKLDEDGYLRILDRKNDRIKVSGFSVWPREIEKYLRERFSGRLQDVGVIGVPDPQKGEVPLAYVVASDPTLSEGEILEVCRQSLAGYQHLKAVEFVSQIPKSATGKILKKELRKLQQQG